MEGLAENDKEGDENVVSDDIQENVVSDDIQENGTDEDNEENVMSDLYIENQDQNLVNFGIEEEVLENVLNESQREITESLREIMREKKTAEGLFFKKVDKSRLKIQVQKVNQVIHNIPTRNITETNDLIRAATVWVAEQLGIKKVEFREKREPWWKRRIERDVKQLRQESNILERDLRGEIKHRNKETLQKLRIKYRVNKKRTQNCDRRTETKNDC